jgi:hypothetical protein
MSSSTQDLWCDAPLEFPEAMELHRTLSTVPFKCAKRPPKISMIEHENERYAVRVKLDCSLKRCAFCCVREFLKSRNLRTIEDSGGIIISSSNSLSFH